VPQPVVQAQSLTCHIRFRAPTPGAVSIRRLAVAQGGAIGDFVRAKSFYPQLCIEFVFREQLTRERAHP
jgi:hypothetical protein